MRTEERLRERFFEKVDWSACAAGHECWEWMASKNSKGYGLLKKQGRSYGAHRIAYELFIGPIPQGLCVCHTCDNPPCVNPHHLWVGTHQDNTLDAHQKGRACLTNLKPQRGEKNGCAKLTRIQVDEIRASYRRGYTPTNTIRLSEKYGVSKKAISRIIRNETWRVE
jgi:hypothetical protein